MAKCPMSIKFQAIIYKNTSSCDNQFHIILTNCDHNYNLRRHTPKQGFVPANPKRTVSTPKKFPPRIPIFVIEHFLVGMHFSEKINLFHGEAIS